VEVGTTWRRQARGINKAAGRNSRITRGWHLCHRRQLRAPIAAAHDSPAFRFLDRGAVSLIYRQREA